MVFLLLIILAVLIMIISRVVRLGENLAGKKGKKNAASDEPAPVQQSAAAGTPLPGTQSQGTLELDGVDEPTAAVIMAIVSDESGIPLNRLLFKSIKKKDCCGSPPTPERNDHHEICCYIKRQKL